MEITDDLKYIILLKLKVSDITEMHIRYREYIYTDEVKKLLQLKYVERIPNRMFPKENLLYKPSQKGLLFINKYEEKNNEN